MKSFYNKTLSASEGRYCVTRRELLAIKSIKNSIIIFMAENVRIGQVMILSRGSKTLRTRKVRLLDGLSFSHSMCFKLNIEPAESITMLIPCLGSVVTTRSC